METHRLIRPLVDVLAESASFDAIADILDELVEVLPPHFEDEEGPGGQLAEIVALLPDREPIVSDLLREHAALSREVAELRRATQELIAQSGAFAERMRAHEATEHQLMCDALCVEAGADP